MFSEMANIMRLGTVPDELVNWFVGWKDHENAEFRAYFVSYLVLMHPHLNPGLSNKDYSYDPNRKPVVDMTY